MWICHPPLTHLVSEMKNNFPLKKLAQNVNVKDDAQAVEDVFMC